MELPFSVHNESGKLLENLDGLIYIRIFDKFI